MAEGFDDGEVALQCDGHGQVNGAHSCDADQTHAGWHQVHGDR